VRGGGRDGEVLITGEHERIREEQRGRLIRREKNILGLFFLTLQIWLNWLCPVQLVSTF